VATVDQVTELNHVEAGLTLPTPVQDAHVGQKRAKAMNIAVDISDHYTHQVSREVLQKVAHHRQPNI
jgi:hypothetical protein